MPYSASHDEHGIALLRALAYLIAHGEGHVTYEQIEGTIHGLEHGRVRFVFEVDGPAMWRTATRLRERLRTPKTRTLRS